MEKAEAIELDAELSELLKPSSFSLAECRAKSRAARNKRELAFILAGEKLVMQARQARQKERKQANAGHEPAAQAGTSSLEVQQVRQAWTSEERAQIEKGRKAAIEMRNNSASHKLMRDSMTSSAASSASFSFSKTTNRTDLVQHHDQLRFNLKFMTLRCQQERYCEALTSARSSATTKATTVAEQP